MSRRTDTSEARRAACRTCGAPLLRQLVGDRAALETTVLAQPLTLDQARALTDPDRLMWCLVRRHGGGLELRWYDASTHPAGCAEHVVDHRCPGRSPLL